MLDLGGQVEHVGGDLLIRQLAGSAHPLPGIELLGPGILLPGVGTQRLGHVSHRGSRPIRDHVGHLGRVVAAVALVHVLDDLLPPSALDVEVDVGRAVSLGRQEPLEQQAQPHRIGLGHPERPARRAVGCRTAALAVDLPTLAEPHDVPDDQEVPREPQGLDDVELVVDLGPRPLGQRLAPEGGGRGP